jgi:hypothetical protein
MHFILNNLKKVAFLVCLTILFHEIYSVEIEYIYTTSKMYSIYNNKVLV